MKKRFFLLLLSLFSGLASLKAQKGLWVGAEVLADHQGTTGLNYFAGYFSKKDQTLYIAPYLQAGYMPNMKFGDSSYKFISLEPGIAAALQFDAFKVKLSFAAVQYTPLDLSAFLTDSKRLLIPSVSLGTGQSLLGIFDINVYYGHSINFGTSPLITFNLSEPYTKVGLNVGLTF
jgi:hypothetical protein